VRGVCVCGGGVPVPPYPTAGPFSSRRAVGSRERGRAGAVQATPGASHLNRTPHIVPRATGCCLSCMLHLSPASQCNTHHCLAIPNHFVGCAEVTRLPVYSFQPSQWVLSAQSRSPLVSSASAAVASSSCARSAFSPSFSGPSLRGPASGRAQEGRR
jgi:hypothetical protein